MRCTLFRVQRKDTEIFVPIDCLGVQNFMSASWRLNRNASRNPDGGKAKHNSVLFATARSDVGTDQSVELNWLVP
jgi:hypothetical protein